MKKGVKKIGVKLLLITNLVIISKEIYNKLSPTIEIVGNKKDIENRQLSKSEKIEESKKLKKIGDYYKINLNDTYNYKTGELNIFYGNKLNNYSMNTILKKIVRDRNKLYKNEMTVSADKNNNVTINILGKNKALRFTLKMKYEIFNELNNDTIKATNINDLVSFINISSEDLKEMNIERKQEQPKKEEDKEIKKESKEQQNNTIDRGYSDLDYKDLECFRYPSKYAEQKPKNFKYNNEESKNYYTTYINETTPIYKYAYSYFNEYEVKREGFKLILFDTNNYNTIIMFREEDNIIVEVRQTLSYESTNINNNVGKGDLIEKFVINGYSKKVTQIK